MPLPSSLFLSVLAAEMSAGRRFEVSGGPGWRTIHTTPTLRSVGVGPDPFGSSLRRLRERSCLTHEQLADRAGLSVKAVSALERATTPLSAHRPGPEQGAGSEW